MPRKGEVPKRESIPDPKYTEAPIDARKRVTKFMNTVMTGGKKSTAEQIVHGAVRPTPLPTTLDQGEGDAGTQACGSNSPIRRAGWVGNRSSTSLR